MAPDLGLALPLDDLLLSLNPLGLLLAELLDTSLLVPSLLLAFLLLLLTSLGLELTSALSLLLLSLLDGQLSSALGGGLSALSLFLSLALDVEHTSSLKHNMVVPLGMDSALHRILLSLSVVSDVSHVVCVMACMVSLVNSVPVSTSSHLFLFVVSMLVSTMSMDISSLSAGCSCLQKALVMSLAKLGSALTLHSCPLLKKNLSPPGSSLTLSLKTTSQGSLALLLSSPLAKSDLSPSPLFLELLHLSSSQTGSFSSVDGGNNLSGLSDSGLALRHVLALLSLYLLLLDGLLLGLRDLLALLRLLLLARPGNILLVGLDSRLFSGLALFDLFHGLFHLLLLCLFSARLHSGLSINLDKGILSLLFTTLAEILRL